MLTKMPALEMIFKDKRFLKVSGARFNNLAPLIVCFMLASCADRIYLPNVGSGWGISIEIDPDNYKSYSFYSNNCGETCKVIDKVSFIDLQKVNSKLISVEFSNIKLDKKDLVFVDKTKVISRKLIAGIKQIEKNYEFIYEDMAKPILVKYHFIPNQISLEDIILYENSHNEIIYHFFHRINKNVDTSIAGELNELHRMHKSLKTLAHEISHIAQKITNFHYPNFDIATEKNEARATIFEMLSMVTLAQLEFRENKKHLKIDFNESKDKATHIKKNQGWNRKTLADGNLKKVYIKKISAKNNFKGYKKGEKEFFKLIGGQTISTWETKKINNLLKAIRDKIRLEKKSNNT